MQIVLCDYLQQENKLIRIIPALNIYWKKCPDCGGILLGIEIAWLTLELGLWFGDVAEEED